MKYLYPFLLFILSTFYPFTGISQESTSHHHPHNTAAVQAQSGSSLYFVQNKGQWDKEVKYRTDIPSGALLLKDRSLQYIFWENAHDDHKASPPAAHEVHDTIHGHSYEVSFLDAFSHQTPHLQGESKQRLKSNFYLGEDRSRWASQAPSFQKVRYESLYPGIDLLLLSQSSSLKYEFYVQTGANPSAIRMEYAGAEKIWLEDENLYIQTSINQVIEKKPFSYQEIKGQKVEVASRFVLVDQVVYFEFPEGYDPNYPLVIDPELVFITYSGAFFDNWGFTATFDAAGNFYDGGIMFTNGVNIGSSQLGPFTLTNQGGSSDIVILKFNEDGSDLLYATLLGGSQSEFPHSLIVNPNNELVIFGTSGSANYPTTAAAIQNTFRGGNPITVSGNDFIAGTDIIVSKLDSNGALLQSTFLGGTGNDGFNQAFLTNYGDEARGEVITDSSGFIYISSSTLSSDFPILGAQSTPLSGGQDGVIMKLSPNLDQIIWSTALGGSASDAAFSLKINSREQIYVCGTTLSNDIPNSFQVDALANTPLGSADAYLARLSPEGALERFTYLGTNQIDGAYLMDLDEEENVYAFGLSFGDYPVFPDTVYHIPNSGQFIQKLDSNLTTSLLSTVFGRGSGSPDISPTAFLVNQCDNIYLAGWGGDTNFGRNSLSSTFGLPVTPQAIRSTTDGNDFYIAILAKDSDTLLYGTFFGGSQSQDHVDGGTSRFTEDGVIYHIACASCNVGGNFTTDLGATPGAWSTRDNSINCNTGAIKIDLENLDARFVPLDIDAGLIPATNACVFPSNILFQYNGLGATSWQWFIDSVLVSTQRDLTWVFDTNGVYRVDLVISNILNCTQFDTASFDFPVSRIQVDNISLDTTICYFDQVQLDLGVSSTDPFTYSWSPTIGLSDPSIPNPIASPDQTTEYIATVTDAFGCTSQDTVTVFVIEELDDDFNILDFTRIPVDTVCLPSELTFVYDTTGTATLDWVWEIESKGTFNNIDTVVLTFDQEGDFLITLSAERDSICPESKIVQRTLSVRDMNILPPNDAVVCFGDSLPLEIQTDRPAEINWTPTTGLSDPTIANPIASPSVSTMYTVIAESSLGCLDTAQIFVDVVPEIILDFQVERQSGCSEPTVLNFTNNSSGAELYEWRLGDGTVLTEASPEAYAIPFPNVPAGEFTVSLTGISRQCDETLTQTLEVEDNQTLPPNVITPDGRGLNEEFTLPNRPNYRLEIYNRWGNKVYESDNYQNDWRGEGILGTYYYVLISPQGVRCRGWIQVIP